MQPGSRPPEPPDPARSGLFRNTAAAPAGDPAQAPAGDRLTAPAGSIPTSDPRGPSLGDCARAFVRYPSPPYLFGAVALALAVRLAQGAWSWRDAVVVGGLLAITPFVEWAIHVYLLHSKPVSVAGRTFELLTAREHRDHHERPAELAGLLIPPYGVGAFLALIALTNWILSFPIYTILGGPRLACATTGVVASFAVLAAYEWTHFLIHTPYKPKGRYYRAIRRNHRLHHYKNEHYWFGVTSVVGDKVIGTDPDQRTIERSPTARCTPTPETPSVGTDGPRAPRRVPRAPSRV